MAKINRIYIKIIFMPRIDPLLHQVMEYLDLTNLPMIGMTLNSSNDRNIEII